MSLNLPVNTGYSPFWQLTGDKGQYQFQFGQQRAKGAWRVAKVFNRYGTRDVQAAINVLIGAVAGTVADARFSQVPTPAGPQAAVPQVTGVGDLGGLRTAVLSSGYNRTTSTPDVNELKRWFNKTLMEQGITYPTRLGPGGGGMIKGGSSAFA